MAARVPAGRRGACLRLLPPTTHPESGQESHAVAAILLGAIHGGMKRK